MGFGFRVLWVLVLWVQGLSGLGLRISTVNLEAGGLKDVASNFQAPTGRRASDANRSYDQHHRPSHAARNTS